MLPWFTRMTWCKFLSLVKYNFLMQRNLTSNETEHLLPKLTFWLVFVCYCKSSGSNTSKQFFRWTLEASREIERWIGKDFHSIGDLCVVAQGEKLLSSNEFEKHCPFSLRLHTKVIRGMKCWKTKTTTRCENARKVSELTLKKTS